jgi:hypothetical protein
MQVKTFFSSFGMRGYRMEINHKSISFGDALTHLDHQEGEYLAKENVTRVHVSHEVLIIDGIPQLFRSVIYKPIDPSAEQLESLKLPVKVF